MVIGIDASRYHLPQKTGIETYSDIIIDGLLKKADGKHEIELYTRCDQKIPEKIQEQSGIKIVCVPGRRFWTICHFSMYLRKNRPDVLFVPSHTLPFHGGKKNCITIHDCAFVHYPKAYSTIDRLHLLWSTRRAVRIADKIIVPSEQTKADLIRFFSCPEEKIAVVHHGAPKMLDCTSERKNQILYIGRIETKKNVHHLVKAFSIFREKQPEWKLILAGKPGKNAEQITNFIKEQKLEEAIIQTGYIDDATKEKLLCESAFLTLPSLYEGFGLPILEAFTAGIPVLTSEGSSTKEVGGPAAHYINPLDVTSIADGIEYLATNKKAYETLQQNIPGQLAQFDWKQSIKSTWNILTSLA